MTAIFGAPREALCIMKSSITYVLFRQYNLYNANLKPILAKNNHLCKLGVRLKSKILRKSWITPEMALNGYS